MEKKFGVRHLENSLPNWNLWFYVLPINSRSENQTVLVNFLLAVPKDSCPLKQKNRPVD